MSDIGDIGDILRDRDRILMVAWTLPNEGALSDSQRRQAIDNFRNYIIRNDLTPADVGKQLGSPKATTIADLLKYDYRSNTDTHVRKMNMWIEQHARAKASALTDKFVSTKVAKAMIGAARLVRENGTMGLVLGPTGIGKSRCAQAIHETTPGSIYLRIAYGRNHPRGFIAAIAEYLHVRKGTGALARNHPARLERVIETLRNSARLIILDEAQKLGDPALELLRDIQDTTGCPILLISTKDLHDRIMKTVDADHGQLYSRFDIVHHLSQGKDVYSGGKPLFSVEDIRKLYQVTPIKLSPDAARYMQGVANQLGHGSLRRCKILLRNAARRARKRQGIDEDENVTVMADDLEWVEGLFRQEASEQETASMRRKKAVGAAEG